ncbi:4928_t:CDS:2, partial [Racocetra persica]
KIVKKLEQNSNQKNPTSLANPEIEFLDTLRLFDPPEIAEIILSLEAKRKYLKVLEILEPIPQFHQTDIFSSGCELLDDHYQVEIGKEVYIHKTLSILLGKNVSISKLSAGVIDDKIDYKEVIFKNKAVVVIAKEDIPRIVDELIWDIEN